VGEFAKAILEVQFANGSIAAMREELVQVVAVAIAAIESIDRNEGAAIIPGEATE